MAPLHSPSTHGHITADRNDCWGARTRGTLQHPHPLLPGAILSVCARLFVMNLSPSSIVGTCWRTHLKTPSCVRSRRPIPSVRLGVPATSMRTRGTAPNPSCPGSMVLGEVHTHTHTATNVSGPQSAHITDMGTPRAVRESLVVVVGGRPPPPIHHGTVQGKISFGADGTEENF